MISTSPSFGALRAFTMRVLDLNYIVYTAPCLREEDYGSDSTVASVVVTV